MKDPTSAEPELREAAAGHTRRRVEALNGLQGLRVGIPQVRMHPHVLEHSAHWMRLQEFFPAELSNAVLERFRAALRSLKERGAHLIPVSLPSSSYALSAYYVLASAEASSNMARYDGIEYGVYFECSLPDSSQLSMIRGT